MGAAADFPGGSCSPPVADQVSRAQPMPASCPTETTIKILLPCGVPSYSFTSTFFGIHFPHLFVPHVAHPNIVLFTFHIIKYNFKEMKRAVTVRVVYYVQIDITESLSQLTQFIKLHAIFKGAEHNLCFLPSRFTHINDHNNSGKRASNGFSSQRPTLRIAESRILLLFKD